MASSDYSFIDIAVLDGVRARFAAGDALAVLSVDLEEVLWANGPGAELFGYPDIEAAIGGASRLGATARRQIKATRGFPVVRPDSPIAVRLGDGFRSPIVTFLASGLTLPDGEQAVLLAVPAQKASAQMREISERAISGFTEEGQFAALIDSDGNVAAATDGFQELNIGQETLRALVEEVSEESDRLVKRHIHGAPRRFPAGFARLTDDPAMHFLVVVDDGDTAAAPAVPDEERPIAEPGVDAAASGDRAEAGHTDAVQAPPAAEDRELPAAPTDTRHEQWYFAGPNGGEAVHTPPSAANDTEASGTAPLPSTAPVRFVWRTDAETRFTTISDDFAKTVGAAAASVTGRRFRDVADAFALDPDGEIAGLLERRDTWSGRTVLWPIAGTRYKAPVDLAALPAYDRDRRFEGFRGFGIVRLGDAVADPDATGIALVTRADIARQEEAIPPQDGGGGTAEPPADEDKSDAEHQPGGEEPDTEIDPFRGEVPALEVTPGEERRGSDKVIRLAEHRPPAGGELSLSEQTAFREIGDRLRREGGADEAETLDEDEATQDVSEEPSEQGEAGPAEMDDGEVERAGAPPIASEPEGVAEAPGPETPEAASPAGGEAALEPAEPATDEGGEAEAPAPDVIPSAFAHAPVEKAGTSLDLAIVAHLPVPLLIHAGDVLHYANEAFLDLTGYADLAALEEAGGLGAIFAEPYDHAEGSEAWDSTLRLLRADEEEVPVDAHLQSVPWKEGKALLLALRRAEQVEAEADDIAALPEGDDSEDLEARLAEMRTIVDTATDGVVIIDNDGRIRSISRPAEALFGFEAEHVIGKPFSSLFAIESQEAAQDYLAGLSDNGVASVLNDGREVIGREAQGRFIPLFMTMGRLPGESGFCAVVRDITQWKKAEEELTQARAQAERSSSQKTDFLARVSHEIRTPLNAIIGFSELMMDEKFGPIGSDRYRDYLRDINRSGNHVLDLVNDLLDISKIEAGEQEMHYEAVSLNDALAETVAMMQPQANRERVIIRSSFASRLPDVVADLKSVRQIALNLLSNAIRYTPAGGQVIVSTAYDGSGAVIIRVRDTGVGMSAVEIDEALKPFKQLNSLKRKRGDGTGLGLPLTRAMVEANRARFSINSSPGEGTLVEVTFPPTRVLAE